MGGLCLNKSKGLLHMTEICFARFLGWTSLGEIQMLKMRTLSFLVLWLLSAAAFLPLITASFDEDVNNEMNDPVSGDQYPLMNDYSEGFFTENRGQWDEELQEEADLAVKGDHYVTGEKLAKNKVKMSSRKSEMVKSYK